MRKVKILALLLAALMVVAVFAGCADTKEIESDVATLDERVTNLENLINGIDKEIDDTNTKLDEIDGKLDEDDTSDKISELEQAIKDQQAANEKAQADANKALADALAGLNQAIEDLKEDLKETDTKVDATVGDTAAVQAAQIDAAAKIAAKKAVYEANEADYDADDYKAIVTILEVAKTEISAATTVEAVAKALADIDAKLAAYVAYDDQLYAYVTKLWGNITEANRETAEKAIDYLYEDVAEHYGEDLDADSIVAYAYGKEGNKTLEINLVAVVKVIEALYDDVTSENVVLDADDWDKYSSDQKFWTLKAVTAEAEDLDDRIEDLKTDGKLTYNVLTSSTFSLLYADYQDWTAAAKKLSADNLALSKEAANMAAAMKTLENYGDAADAYKKLGSRIPATTDRYDVFEEFKYDTWNAYEGSPFYTLSRGVFYSKDIFDKIDAKINAWIAEYELSADDAAAIIDAAHSEGFYKEYVADRTYVDQMDAKWTEFADIVAAVKKLNKVKELSKDTYTLYADLEELIDDWKIVVEADEEKDIDEVVVNETNFDLMVALSKIVADEDGNNTYTTGAYNEYRELVTWADEAVEAFFAEGGVYETLSAEAELINDSIEAVEKDFKAGKINSVLEVLKIKGGYVQFKSATDYPNMITTTASKFLTEGLEEGTIVADDYVAIENANNVAAFEKKCVENKCKDLASVLIDYKALSDLESTVSAFFTSFKAGAENLEKLLNAVAWVELCADSYDKTTGAYTNLHAPDQGHVCEDEGCVAVKYVTLADKASFQKVIDAYGKWIDTGAHSEMKLLVNALDEDDKIINADLFVLEPIIADEFKTGYSEINNRIKLLTDAAKALQGHYTKLETALTVDANDTFVAGKFASAFAYTSYKYSDSKYTYKIMTGFNADQEYKSKSSLDTSKGVSINKLIEAGSTKYAEFSALNANYIVKDGKLAEDKYNYVEKELAATAASIAKFTTLYVKDAALVYAASVKADLGVNGHDYEDFKGWIESATSVASIVYYLNEINEDYTVSKTTTIELADTGVIFSNVAA